MNYKTQEIPLINVSLIDGGHRCTGIGNIDYENGFAELLLYDLDSQEIIKTLEPIRDLGDYLLRKIMGECSEDNANQNDCEADIEPDIELETAFPKEIRSALHREYEKGHLIKNGMLRITEVATGRVLVDEELKAGETAWEKLIPELELVIEEVEYHAFRKNLAKFFIISKNYEGWKATVIVSDKDLMPGMSYDYKSNAVILEGYEHSVIIRKA